VESVIPPTVASGLIHWRCRSDSSGQATLLGSNSYSFFLCSPFVQRFRAVYIMQSAKVYQPMSPLFVKSRNPSDIVVSFCLGFHFPPQAPLDFHLTYCTAPLLRSDDLSSEWALRPLHNRADLVLQEVTGFSDRDSHNRVLLDVSPPIPPIRTIFGPDRRWISWALVNSFPPEV